MMTVGFSDIKLLIAQTGRTASYCNDYFYETIESLSTPFKAKLFLQTRQISAVCSSVPPWDSCQSLYANSAALQNKWLATVK